MFELSSAPEKYQKVMSDVLKSCGEIAYDIIVFGTNTSEYNARLNPALVLWGQYDPRLI